MPTPPNQSASLPYEKNAPNAYSWTERAYEMLGTTLHASVRSIRDVQTARVTGSCPRCGHEVGFEQVLDVVTGEDLGTLGSQSPARGVHDFVELTVACHCSELHDGRPNNKKYGCGVHFRIDVRPELS